MTSNRWRRRSEPERKRSRHSASAVFDEPVVISKLVARYAVTGLMALVVVAVVTAYVSRSLGTAEAIEDANRIATLTAGAAIEPVLDDEVISGGDAALDTLDYVVRNHVLRGNLVRVKIWAPDGRIVYSDEPRLIGEQFTLEDEEVEMLEHAGEVEAEAELSDLSEPENRYENAATELLEVYLPVETTGGTPLLFEAYFRYTGVTEAGRTTWLRFAPLLLGALALLELLQVPLALSLARRLRRAQYQREELLRSAIEATEEERRRIASDLHDGVVQDLAGVAFSLGAMARQDGDPAEQRGEIRKAAAHVRDSVRSLRSLLVEIYPPNLYEEGLGPALSDLLARMEPRGIQPSLAIDAPLDGLDLDQSQLLYRTAQEGLRNVVAHAQATRVDVSLTSTERGVLLEVADDGRGMEGDEVPEKEGHLGLRSLAALASTMGATMRVRSTAGKGTVLSLEVPTR